MVGRDSAARGKDQARDGLILALNETEGHLLSARDLGLLSLGDWEKFSTETVEIRRMTYTYRKTVLQTTKDE